jgi:hypothetical protein
MDDAACLHHQARLLRQLTPQPLRLLLHLEEAAWELTTSATRRSALAQLIAAVFQLVVDMLAGWLSR